MNLTKKQQLARTRLCVALDNFDDIDKLKLRVEELAPVAGMFKIGKSTFTYLGPQAIHAVHNARSEVFLDLKYKDIPKTVGDAVYAAASHGVKMLNIHMDGGKDMVKAARDAAVDAQAHYGSPQTKVLGVTVLTSLDGSDLHKMGIGSDPHNVVYGQVIRFARMAEEGGLDGIVCSGQDLEKGLPLNMIDKKFLYVTPGISGPRLGAGSDQKRVMTPGRAIQAGSSYVVVGRAINVHKTPEERFHAALDIVNDIVPYL